MKSKSRDRLGNGPSSTVRRNPKNQPQSTLTPPIKAKKTEGSLFDRMLDGIYRSTHEGRFIDVNPAFVKMFGYCNKQEMLGIKDIKKELYFLPEDRASHFLDIGQERVEVYRMRKRDGSEIWVEDHGHYVHDDHGRVIYHEGILRDVTEQKHMEEKLKALHTHALRISKATGLDEIVQTTLDAMQFALGFAYGSFSTTENGYCRVHDFRGESPSVCELDLNGPGIIVKAVADKKSIRISDCAKEPAYVPPYSHPDQARTMLSELVVPIILNGEAVAILNVENTRVDAFSSEDQMLLEILANHVAATLNRIRQEDELRRHSERLQELVEQRTRKLSESEARFRELADMLPQIVFELQRDGRIEFLNREGLRSLGYTEEELQKGLNALGMIRSDEVEQAKESARKAMSGANPDDTKRDGREFNLVRKDGSTFPALIYSYPIARNGMAAGLRGIAIDITEQKRIEEQLLKAKHITAIGETAAMVGHDLRNPLQGAAGAVYLIRDLVKSGKTVEEANIAELLDILEGAIYYMDKIVRDLQSYAAPVTVSPIKTDVRTLIEETISSVRLPENVEAKVLAQEDISNIDIDPALLRHVLTNLTINGVQAMPEGGKLTVQCSKFPMGLVLSIRDTGTGIAPENRNKLFTPFFTTKAQGQGLGLAVCKRLIEAHGGTINVESDLGSGSVFTIKIPTTSTQHEC